MKPETKFEILKINLQINYILGVMNFSIFMAAGSYFNLAAALLSLMIILDFKILKKK